MTEDELRKAAEKMQAVNLNFLFEGIAALLTHEADKIRDEKLPRAHSRVGPGDASNSARGRVGQRAFAKANQLK